MIAIEDVGDAAPWQADLTGRALFVVGVRRVLPFPDLPCAAEVGLAPIKHLAWAGFLAPAGIPDDARKALVSAIEQAVKSPTITAKLAPLGTLQGYATPEQMSAEMREEFKRVSDVARRAGMVK